MKQFLISIITLLFSIIDISTGFIPISTTCITTTTSTTTSKSHYHPIVSNHRWTIVPTTLSRCNHNRVSNNERSILLLLSQQDNNNDNKNNDSDDEKSKSLFPTSIPKIPTGSLVLILLSVKSLYEFIIFPSELPAIYKFIVSTFQNQQEPFDINSIDLLASVLDIFFIGFGTQNLLQQFGVTGNQTNKKNNDSGMNTLPNLAGYKGRLTLNVGREKGTWMDKEWGDSGSRLLLPVKVLFSKNNMELPFPGEESMGGRFCKKLQILEPCSIVGPKGVIGIPVMNGGWTILPLTDRSDGDGSGEFKLRFFLDFPQGASRSNDVDVNLPPGRVFFSGVIFENAQKATLMEGESVLTIRMDEEEEEEEKRDEKSTTTIGILTEGGLSMKKNSITNLYGALGDVNVIVGRYSISKMI